MLTWWNHDPEEEVNVGWNQQNVPMNQYYSKHLFWGETPRPHKPPQTAIFFLVVNKLYDITGDKGGGQISSELCVYFLNKNTDTSFGWQQSRRPTKTAIFTSSTYGGRGRNQGRSGSTGVLPHKICIFVIIRNYIQNSDEN